MRLRCRRASTLPKNMLATDISQKIVAHQSHMLSALVAAVSPVLAEWRIRNKATNPAIFGTNASRAQAPAWDPWNTSGA